MIHGGRSQSQRTAALTGFQQGRFRILVATDLAARGIHVDDISQVINYDLPDMAENFIHRVGRSGRAGALGLASTLFSIDQRGELLALERTLGIKIERMKAADLPERQDRKPRLATRSRARDLQNQPASRRVSAGANDVIRFPLSAGLAARVANKGPADSSAGPLLFELMNGDKPCRSRLHRLRNKSAF